MLVRMTWVCPQALHHEDVRTQWVNTTWPLEVMQNGRKCLIAVLHEVGHSHVYSDSSSAVPTARTATPIPSKLPADPCLGTAPPASVAARAAAPKRWWAPGPWCLGLPEARSWTGGPVAKSKGRGVGVRHRGHIATPKGISQHPRAYRNTQGHIATPKGISQHPGAGP